MSLTFDSRERVAPWLPSPSSARTGPYSVAVRVSVKRNTSGLLSSDLDRIRAVFTVHKTQSPQNTSWHVVVIQNPRLCAQATVVQMGSSASNISPGKDLLDLHGRVAIVTGAKYVI